MVFLNLQSKVACVLGSRNSQPQAGVGAESHDEMSAEAMKVPLMTEEEAELSTTSKENHAVAAKECVLRPRNAQPKAGVGAESNNEMCEESFKLPLITEEERDFRTASKENHTGAVKAKLAAVIGKASASARRDVGKVKEQLLMLRTDTMSDARSAVKVGANAIRNVQEHLQIVLCGKPADSECIKALSASGFCEKDIEKAIFETGCEDIAVLEVFLRRSKAYNVIAVEKLLAMGFAQEDVENAVRKFGAQDLELVVDKLCKLQDNRLKRAQRKEALRVIATSLPLGDFNVEADEDRQLKLKLAKCFGSCNQQLATCLRLVESGPEKPVGN